MSPNDATWLLFLGPLLPWLSAAFALLAAGLWVVSSRVTVPYIKPQPGESRGGTVLYTDSRGRLHDVPATLYRQSSWNRWAALAAAAAAVFQALSVVPPFGPPPACPIAPQAAPQPSAARSSACPP